MRWLRNALNLLKKQGTVLKDIFFVGRRTLVNLI